MKPFYETVFDTAQKQDFQYLLNALVDRTKIISKREINNQLFPFDFPDDLQKFYSEIKKIFFEQ